MFRLGIVGCGRVVEEAHAPALRLLQNQAEVVALCDPSLERRRAVGAVLGGGTPSGYADLAEMLSVENLDAVIVAVPHHLHEQVLVDVAKAKLDIIAEKPLATTLDEVDRIVEAVRESGVRVSVMHNWRYNADAAAGLAAIAEGRIGRPFLVRNESIWGAPWASKDPNEPDWRQTSSRSGGGVVIDVAYHSFYVAEEEMLSPVQTVFASTGAYGGTGSLGVEDVATVVLVHRDGGTSCIQRCWLAKGGGTGAHEVHGTAGSIRFRQSDSKVLSAIFSGDYGALASLPRPDRPPVPVEIFENTVGEWRPLLEPADPIPWWDGMKVVFATTFDAWESSADAPVGIGEARHGLAIVRAAYLSAERGAVVELAEVEGG